LNLLDHHSDLAKICNKIKKNEKNCFFVLTEGILMPIKKLPNAGKLFQKVNQ
jgi:hypothetical protein